MEEKLDQKIEEDNHSQVTEIPSQSSNRGLWFVVLLGNLIVISAVCALAYFGYSYQQIQEQRFKEQTSTSERLDLQNQKTAESILNLGGKVSVLELVYQQASKSQETITEMQRNILGLENQIARLEGKNANLVENLSRLSSNMNDLLLSIEQERNILAHFKLQQKLMRLESLWSETLDNKLLATEITKLQQNQDLQEVLSEPLQRSMNDSLLRLESLKSLSLEQVLDSLQELETRLTTHRKNIFTTSTQHSPPLPTPSTESILENVKLWLIALWQQITFFDLETQAGISETQLLQVRHLEQMSSLLQNLWLALASQNFSLVDVYLRKIQQEYASKDYQSLLSEESLKLLPEQLEELRRRSASSLIF